MIENIIGYLDDVSSKKEVIKRKQVEIDKVLSTNFSLFNYLYFGENKLSEIFRDLLDPNGSHGQGELFFNSFLEIVFMNEPAILQKLSSLTFCKPVIKTEVYTSRISNKYRRIDIVLEWNNDFAIGIENKPFDKDQENQLTDYAEHLEKVYTDFCLIYLADKEVTERSITKVNLEKLKINNKFKQIKYSEEINSWLYKCYLECQSPKVKFFLEDLKNKLSDHFIAMEIKNVDEIVEYTISEDKNIAAIFDLHYSYENVLNAVAMKFVQSLKLNFSNELFEIKDETVNSKINIQFKMKSWKKDLWCCVSTEYHDNIFLGIWDENNILNNEFIVKQLSELNSNLEKGGENNWIWWSFPESKYQNWQNNSDKIILMNNCDSTDYYTKQLFVMFNIIDQHLTNI